MLHRIRDIKPLPGLCLQAVFQNGELRIYDVAPLQERWPAFRSLTEIPGLFELVRVDAGGYGVVWNDEIDLAAEEIWNNGKDSARDPYCSDSTDSIECVSFDELEPDEQAAVIEGQKEIENGDTIDFEDYLKERGIDINGD